MPSPTVTTTLRNAIGASASADAVPFVDPKPLAEQPRTPDGAYILPPGAYEGEVSTYALSPGRAAPGRGTGYVAAELDGPRAKIVAKVVERASFRTDVFQEETQQVIWAIVTRAKLDTSHPAMGVTMRIVLTDGELTQLNNSNVPVFSEDQLDDMFKKHKVPVEARPAIVAQNQLRALFVDPKASFADMEAVAVPKVGDEGPGTGMWTRSEDGFAIRFLPSGYARTKVQIVVTGPPPADPAAPPAEPACVAANLDALVAAPDAPDRQRLLLATGRDPAVAALKSADGEKPIAAALLDIVKTCEERVAARAGDETDCAKLTAKKRECVEDLVREAAQKRVLFGVTYDKAKTPQPHPAPPIGAACRIPPAEPIMPAPAPPPPRKGAKPAPPADPCAGYLCTDLLVLKEGATSPSRDTVVGVYALAFACGATPPPALDAKVAKKFVELLGREPTPLTPPPPPAPRPPAPTPPAAAP